MPPETNAALLLPIVRRPLATLELGLDALAQLAGESHSEDLLALQVFAMEARYEEGSFPLTARREIVLGWLVALLEEKEAAVRRER